MKNFVFLLGCVMSSLCGMNAQTVSDSIMRVEAEAFRRGLPEGLQSSQKDAILRAIEGDCEALERVRHGRNSKPPLREGVVARDISPTMRLYGPEGVGGALPLLIYFHGGGWTIGSINSCARFCQEVAASGKARVLAVDYRLAPESPYPAGLEDCREAVGFAFGNAAEIGADSDRVFVGGDSSGGNLALATALSGDECCRRLAGVVCFYPVTKAYPDGSASWAAYGSGYGLDADLMEAFNSAYIGHLKGDVAGDVNVGDLSDEALEHLPRTLLVAAGRDILCNQGREFATRVGAQRLTRVEFPQAVHLFITVGGQPEAFRRAVELTVGFIGGE